MFQLLLFAGVAVTAPVSIAEWRWAVFSIGVGTILLTIGLLATGIYLFRRRGADRTLLYFGVYVVLYAVRIFMREPAFVSVFSISPAVATHINRAITFSFALPLFFLFLEVVQARWRRVFLWALGIQLIFAAVAIPLDFLGIGQHGVDIANSLLVLGSWTLLIAFLFFLRPPGRLPRDLRVVAVGLGVLAVFVLHANLAGLGLIRGRDVEPVGFLFFACTLGYLVAHRIFVKEENLLSIQKELQIAEQIQTSILPRELPRFPGFDLTTRYLPMRAVAGDFYDFLTPQPNQLGILVADVTGHGVPAALIASMLKIAFAGQKIHAQHPERVLSGLNQALCGKFEEHFVTAAYLYVDLDAKLLRYAGAGHPPLLCSSAPNGDARAIEQNGYFLGMFPEANYSSLEFPLHSGDRYVLYTDGVPESRNAAGEEFGLDRCKQFLSSHSRLPASALADGLLGEIANWSDRTSGASQEDDITLIVIDCLQQS